MKDEDWITLDGNELGVVRRILAKSVAFKVKDVNYDRVYQSCFKHVREAFYCE